jgi:oligopeptide transport system permease protein
MPESSYTTSPPQDVAGAALTGDVTADTASAPKSPGSGKPRSLWSDAWHDLRRNPMFVVSALLIIFLIIVAAFPGLFTSADPKFCELANSNGGGTPGHPFGFDRQGCDIYSRVIYGARASVTVGILVTTGVVFIGGIIGAIAAFYGGAADSVLSRLADVFFAIPLLLGAIVFLQAFPSRNIWTVTGAIMVLGWPQVCRIMRGSVISVKESDFVTAARALGAGDLRILVRHILPNAIAPVIVIATLSLGQFIVLEATLSFLGIGLPGTTVSWGGDISDAQASLQVAPHVLLFPSVALSITVLAFMLLGDAVRDALDPKLR